ncbi:MAG: glycine--tRNA ligase subunit beta, partial [Nitrospirota bacterium]|nr:glycine--tRNA ligase subunit beta [Nitrospirota bacterium]
AKFYFEEDRKRLLFDRIEDLKKVTFHDKLGSLYEKTKRVASIAEFLANKSIPSEKDRLISAAWLSKTDLVTGIVREFPELQGIMGKYYAINEGKDPEIAEALGEQYLPAHSGGNLPKREIGSLLSIADKIDNVSAFFSLGLIPTGSEDPFALRRQALGIIAILLDKGYTITLTEIIDNALENFSDINNSSAVKANMLQFFEQRFEPVFSEQGYSLDLILSILALSLDIQLNDTKERLDTLQKFKEDKEYNDFLLAIKRVHNIIPEAELPELRTDLLIEESERMLKENLDSVKYVLTGLLEDKKYHDIIKLFSSLTGPINHFFDHVLVMDKREEIKQNRLALLKEIWRTVSVLADFSKLSAS